MEAIATSEKIEEICELIEKEGGKVTLENVRMRLGGGSKSTISVGVRTWREKKRPTQPDSETARLEDLIGGELVKKLTSSIVWHGQSVVAEMAAAREALERDYKELMEASKKTESEKENLAAELEEKESEIIRLSTLLEKTTSDFLASQEALLASAVDQEKLTALSNQVADLSGQLEAEKAARKAAEEAARKVLSENLAEEKSRKFKPSAKPFSPRSFR